VYALVNSIPAFLVSVEIFIVNDPRSTVRTMKLLVSRATIRHSKSLTSEHWYVVPPNSVAFRESGSQRFAYRLNKSCSLRIVHTPSLLWLLSAR